VSQLAPATAEIAAALARHARQGRDLRLAVLGWFAEVGLSEVLDTVVPEQAVLDALECVIASSPWYQLFAQARAARTETQKDRFTPPRASPPPRCRRRWRESIPLPCVRPCSQEPELDVLPVWASVIQLLAAIGMGYAEVGADVLAEAFSGSGLGPPVSSWFWEQWLARLRPRPPARWPSC
jgi:hypothetical protein